MKLYEIYLQEAGFEKMPKGWTQKSVKKAGQTIATDVDEKSPKEVGFFDKCVKKMQGKVDKPEGYCAALKDVSHGSTYWRGKGKTKKQAMAASRRHRNVGEHLDNLAIAHMISEYEENDYIKHCIQYDCPKKKLVCLKMSRALCGANKVCQQRIDRARDELLGSYDGSGDDPHQDLKNAGPSLPPHQVGAVVVKKEDIISDLPLRQLMKIHGVHQKQIPKKLIPKKRKP